MKSKLRYLPLQKKIIFGPVKSRRLGRSLGINLMPTKYKICSFNCNYCYFGWNNILADNINPYIEDLPTPIQVEQALESKLLEYKEKKKSIDFITITGNGEDTLHPQFGEIVERIKKTRDNIYPEIPLAIFSNSSTALKSEVREALSKFDFRFMKLDAPNSHLFKIINIPAKNISFEDIIKGLKQMHDIIIQAAFIENSMANFKLDYIPEWIKIIKEIKPLSLQIYRTCYVTADQNLKNANFHTLQKLKKSINNKYNIEISLY